jgi:hypothetical protein
VQDECLFASELKRAKAEGTKCHAKTMMSIKADKTIQEKTSMCKMMIQSLLQPNQKGESRG